MPHLGVPELVLILLIVIAVFGTGKLANLGGALGKGVHDFRTSLKDEESAKNSEIAEATKAVANGPAPQVVSAPPAAPETAAEPQAASEETEPSA